MRKLIRIIVFTAFILTVGAEMKYKVEYRYGTGSLIRFVPIKH